MQFSVREIATWRTGFSRSTTITSGATSLHVPGDFVECGVNAGFISSAIMRHLSWNALDRRFHLIDTFSGPVFDQYSPEEVARGRRSIARDALAAGSYVTDLAR